MHSPIPSHGAPFTPHPEILVIPRIIHRRNSINSLFRQTIIHVRHEDVLFHIPSNQGTFLLLLKHIFYPHNCWIDTRKPIKVLIHNHFLLISPFHSPPHFHDEPTRDKRKIHNVTRKLEKKENPSLYLQIFSQQIDLLSHSLSLECIRGLGPFLLRFNGSPGLEMFNWLSWYY